MSKSYSQTRSEEYMLRFEAYTVYQLVNVFNREANCRGWSGERGIFLAALMDTFKKRKVNMDSVADASSVRLRPVFYDKDEHKLVRIIQKFSDNL